MSDLPEGGRPTKPPQTSPRSPRRFGWHHVYYLLATLNLATLALSLYQNHRILTIYRDSVSVDQEWDERIDSYSVLTQLAAAVNAPGNDVFASRDVERESARLEMARRQFEQASGAATASLRAHPEPAIAAPVLHGLERTAAAMRSMVAEAEAIFASFRRADPGQAGQRMAAMDHRYAEVRAALDEVRRGAREVQRRNLGRQASAAVAHAANEYVIGTLILVLVAAVTAYGSRLARRVESHRRERERFLAQLQEAEAQTRAIFDAAADGIITVDERQRIVSFNAAAERIFGYPAGCVAGGEAAVLFAPSSDEPVGRFFEDQIGTSETRVVRSEGVRRDGTRFPVDLTGSTGRAGGRPLVIAIVRDVTDQERAESLRRRYSQELESKVRESTQHLESALARQSELAQRNAEAYEVVRRTQAELLRRERLAAVGEMAATVAHGLRNPLASIRAAAEVGQEHMSEPSLVRETLGDIVTEASRLEDRIAGVLDFARPVQPSLASGDVNRVVAAFFDDLRSRVPQATRLVLDLEPGIPPIVFDALHLREALGALALNAVEAGAGQVTISSALERGENGGSSVTLSVADTGPGIGPNRINQIFDLFYTTKPSRSGVGLTVARRLLEAQGGRLDVSSRPSGTTFLIRLPLRRGAAESGAPSP